MAYRLKVYPYKQGSTSAKALAEQLECKVLKHEGSTFKGGPNRLVINWGSSSLPSFRIGTKVLNPPEKTKIAGNKLDFFKRISSLQSDTVDTKFLVPWTEDKEVAEGWKQEGYTVVCRESLTGHSGVGIKIIQSDSGLDIPEVPLYTKYIRKQEEYRVHVIKNPQGEYICVDTQKKVRNPDREPISWHVRSHQNGFIFIRNGVSPSDGVLNAAKKTVELLGLDFGAVDIIKTKQGRVYVLEVNCAPGLSGQTVTSYSNAFKEYV